MKFSLAALSMMLIMVPAGSAPVPEPDELEEVRQILREIAVQPSPLTRSDGASLRAEDLPRFSSNVLAAYARDNTKSDFRDAVVRAKDQLESQIAGLPLKDQILAGSDMIKLKQEVLDHQKEVARAMRTLQESLERLKAAGGERDKENSKRWQAHYDYILARLQFQIAFLYEYQTALARIRREDLPALSASSHNAWKLVLSERETGDVEGKKYSAQARKLLAKIVKDNPGSPWAEISERTLKLPSGLEWQSVEAK